MEKIKNKNYFTLTTLVLTYITMVIYILSITGLLIYSSIRLANDNPLLNMKYTLLLASLLLVTIIVSFLYGKWFLIESKNIWNNNEENNWRFVFFCFVFSGFGGIFMMIDKWVRS